MQKRLSRGVRVLAWALIFCLLLGTFPVSAAEPRAAGETISVSTTAQLVAAVEKLNGEVRGGTIILSDAQYQLTEPLVITNEITIQGSGRIKVPIGTGSWTTGGSSMIQVTGSSGRLSLCGDITVDPQSQCRAILVTGGGNLHLDGATIQNGRVSASESGAGILVSGSGSQIYAGGGTTFLRNAAALSSPTSGGALYVGNGSSADLEDVTFQENRAHSGGAIYTYHGLVICSAETKFIGNSASQRGGAIHDHGTVVLNGTTIQGQKSDQYGGAIYVSANRTETSDDFGRLILSGVTITDNTAGNSGGGVYVADLAQVLISKSTKVTGNTASADAFTSNLFAATADSKIIATGSLTCGQGELGVSTSNPYLKKVLVYSLLPEHLAVSQGAATEEDWTQWGIPESYTMTSEDMSKFTYDSDIFVLAKAKTPASPNDMWLKINPDNPDASSSPKVIFDFNLPGNPAVVYPSAATLPSIDVGDALTLPTVQSEIKSGNITYTFLGWYSDATGGTRYTDAVTVAEGTRVYYAQWLTKVSSSGGTGVPGTAGLNLVYFDQNYEGGGLTTAYTFGGQFTFTVTFEGPDGEETSEDVDVYVPFEMPGDPFRDGYLFTGWSEDPSATFGVFQDSGWAPANSVTTLYATWRANTCTLTWDANGGSNGSSTTQDYSTTILPPAKRPTREGHVFTGWYLDSDCTVPLTSGTQVRGDATFYAGWTPLEFTIT